jgi:CheY-like chemotaxis protein
VINPYYPAASIHLLKKSEKSRHWRLPPARDEYAGLRGKAWPIPITGLTAHVRKEDDQASSQAGMNGFLAKPLVSDKLAVVLAEHLAGI